MKLIKYSIIFIAAVFLLASCEKDYESYISETPAPQMELYGSNPMVLFKGTPYEDPGIYAIEIANGDTTELDYQILNEVNVEVPGTYKLMYQVTNSEGFNFYLSRNVSIVSFTGYDVFEMPSGTYDGIRVNRDAGGEVQITKLAPGVYQISDLLAGYYDQYVGYGSATAGPGILVIDENGEMRSELGNTAAWGGVTGQGFNFDQENNVLTYTIVFDDDGFAFDVQLTFKE
ncbi:BT_2262 family domain-containing protein [uncultured Draconibacterium sp.]|uniref:BT_2262 family domain-containing protein n=1 Tax=uncultured Draconibacterium sp. TaxID=1573823 RepID=UPI0029C055C1|nr:BT_2262 family domain-containing protein [uncultured Draconibacterium sp.]